jgi:hypothetical protein
VFVKFFVQSRGDVKISLSLPKTETLPSHLISVDVQETTPCTNIFRDAKSFSGKTIGG